MWSYLNRQLQRIINFFRPAYRAKDVEDFPELLELKTVYAVGAPVSPWVLAFLCPCGCKAIIQLNLLKEARPRWSYKVSKKGDITVQPSIWRKQGCQSHFFIRRGKIVWC
ncbi:DUF6527 family protein [Pontibacter fetidus]|uniref:DUF6527 family protein n=1 Tax=Pontibacter fetidus TaxID=2700082 RepID=UPI0037444BBC